MTELDEPGSELEFSPDQLAIRAQVRAQVEAQLRAAKLSAPFNPERSVASVAEQPKSTRRAEGTGSFYYNTHKKLWIGRLSVGGKKYEVSAKTRDLASAKLYAAIPHPSAYTPQEVEHLYEVAEQPKVTKSNSGAPESMSYELLLKVGGDVLGRCEWQGEHLVWMGKNTHGTAPGESPSYKMYSSNSALADRDLAKLEGTPSLNRIVWKRVFGPIPAKGQIWHNCDVSLCLRPDHLDLRINGIPIDQYATKPNTYRLEVLIMEPVRTARVVQSDSFEGAIAQARQLPGLVEVLSIQKGE